MLSSGEYVEFMDGNGGENGRSLGIVSKTALSPYVSSTSKKAVGNAKLQKAYENADKELLEMKTVVDVSQKYVHASSDFCLMSAMLLFLLGSVIFNRWCEQS